MRGWWPSRLPALWHKLDTLREAATTSQTPDGLRLIDDPVFQREIGELEAEVASYAHYEKLAISGHPMADDPAFPSMSKTMNSELAQRLTAMMTRVAGLGGLPEQLAALQVGGTQAPLGTDFELTAMPFYLNTRATSIYAGTNEVQRDLIARTLAGG